jgi:hypothetical protein
VQGAGCRVQKQGTVLTHLGFKVLFADSVGSARDMPLNLFFSRPFASLSRDHGEHREKQILS